MGEKLVFSLTDETSVKLSQLNETLMPNIIKLMKGYNEGGTYECNKLQSGGERKTFLFSADGDRSEDGTNDQPVVAENHPNKVFSDFVDYTIGIDSVLVSDKVGSDRSAYPLRPEPFTWEGPRKSDHRRYLGNSLVAGPYWPVDIYSMIDHMFYKTTFIFTQFLNIFPEI